MPQAGIYVLASLISSGVSAALILATGPSYTAARSSQGTAYNAKQGQATHNECQTGPCQIVYLNSAEDFCLWAPPQPALLATKNTEHTLVAWCTKSTHGTRLIPDGTISAAHLVITPEYVQITGVGNLTDINVPADDVVSVSGQDDLAPGLVFTHAYGQLEQIYDWMSFVSQERFCFRACKPSATASIACSRIHDIPGCSENIPGDYDPIVFKPCIGDAIEIPSTLYQEILAAPSYYSAYTPSSCTSRGTIVNGRVTRARRAVVSVSGSIASTPVTSLSPSTTTDTATTITFPSLPASMLSATTFMSPSTPVATATTPTSALYSYSYTHTYSHRHSHTYRHSHRRSHSPTSSASVAASSSSHGSFNHSRSSSSTAPSLSDPPWMSSGSLPASLTPSFTLTFSAFEPSVTLTLSVTPTPSMSTSFAFSSSGTFSSLSDLSASTASSVSFLPTSSTHSPSDTPSATVPPSDTSTSTPTPIMPTSTSSILSPSYATSSSWHSPPQSPTPSSIPTPASRSISPSTSPSTSSQSSEAPTSITSSSVPAATRATSSLTFPNSQTQLGSQCPPPSRAVNAGSVTPSFHLLPLTLTAMIVAIVVFVL